MKEIINVFDYIKNNFSFLPDHNFSFFHEEVFNRGTIDHVWGRLKYKNKNYGRELIFDVSPKSEIRINVIVVNIELLKSFSIDDYLCFKEHYKASIPLKQYFYDFQMKHQDCFLIRKDSFQQDIKSKLDDLNYLLTNDLHDVIVGKEWISLPSYDQRDEY